MADTEDRMDLVRIHAVAAMLQRTFGSAALPLPMLDGLATRTVFYTLRHVCERAGNAAHHKRDLAELTYTMDLPEPGRLTPTNSPLLSYNTTDCRQAGKARPVTVHSTSDHLNITSSVKRNQRAKDAMITTPLPMRGRPS